jgi:hypothetical protein
VDLSCIVGQELTAVEFVQDYLQLRFDGPLLTLFVWPDVFREEGSYAYGEPEFRNVLWEEDLDVPQAGQFSESGQAGDITFEF